MSLPLCLYLTNVCTVYPVHWLRAKSQRDRCCKEVELLQCEMSWMKNFFLHQANCWQALNQLAESSGNYGLQCYSTHQHTMYTCLAAQFK
ncbi:hypothetical protein EDC04DRAFT_2578369 [Pisolithus marmoratus]|nr:hypothetical protein EDC04DRAFT_2578369 [Pisolithus marmoratus]